MVNNDNEDIDLLKKLLMDSDEKFKLLYESEPFVYDSLDENGNIIEVSRGWLNLLGYKREEVIGKWLGDFLTPEFREDFRAHWQETKEIGIVDNVYLKYIRKDGTIVDSVIYARMRYDKDGRYIRSHCLTHDISERKKANEALRKSEYEKALILDVMSDSIIYRDTDMKVIWANRNAAALFKLTPEEMVGKYCFRENAGKEAPCIGCLIEKALKSGQPVTGEQTDGKNTYIVRAYPVRNSSEELIGVVHVARDITDRKRLEREIMESGTQERQKFGRDLHDGLGQLLTGIAFYAQALKEQLEAKALPEAADAGKLEEITEKALRLTSRLAKGLDPVGLDTNGFFTSVSELLQSTESIFGVSCIFTHDAVPSDIDRDMPIHLYYIIQEAINNSIKHGKADIISVHIQCSDGEMVLSVNDNGKGLPKSLDNFKGMGLQSMKYRTSTLGGFFSICNNETAGVKLTCSFPRRVE